MVGAVTAGTKLGHYECTTALQDSDLWLARSDRGGHFVLRILTAEQVQDPKFVRMSDAWGSNELHQASIAGIEDIAEEQGIHYVATEYVHGEALVQLLARVEERGKQISLQHILAIAVSIAEAMHHAHELGIQCSITPAQVLIGYDGVVKVDLGRVGAAPRPAYRSPEQAGGLATDRRSDVFVIGILLYECVTLHRLFETGPGPIARPSTLRKGLPSEIEKIVMRALATEASDRYVNAGELRAALSQFASKAGMKLGSDSLAAYMKQMFEKRELPWVAGGKPSHASRSFGRAGTRPVGDRAATAASPARKRTPAAGAELDTVVQSPDRNFDTSDSTMEGRKFDGDDVTNKLPPAGGTEDPTGKVAFLNGDNAKTTTAKIPDKKIPDKKVTNGEAAKTAVKVVSPPSVAAKRAGKPVVVVPSPEGKVAGKLVPVDPTEETKLPDGELADETVVSPPPIVEKPAPVKRPVIAKSPAKLPAAPQAAKLAAERAESEVEGDELRIPTMIATPPPPPLVITATTLPSGDSTAVVKPLPMPGQRARRPSTAKAAAASPGAETDTDEIVVAGPSRKKILIGVAVAVAIAIPLVIVLWPDAVAEKVAQQKAVEPEPVVERPGPIAAGPDPSERAAAEGSAEAGSSEPTEPAPAEPTPAEPAPTEPPPTAEPPPPEPTPGEPKPSVFVPRDSGSGSGSAEAPKPKPAPVKATPKPKPRVAATKPKPGKKPVTKTPKGPTYDPDSLFLKKK